VYVKAQRLKERAIKIPIFSHACIAGFGKVLSVNMEKKQGITTSTNIKNKY